MSDQNPIKIKSPFFDGCVIAALMVLGRLALHALEIHTVVTLS
jgi:hypothetical protein